MASSLKRGVSLLTFFYILFFSLNKNILDNTQIFGSVANFLKLHTIPLCK